MDKSSLERRGRLEGLVAVVVGGHVGNGYGISDRFLAEGAKVCLAGRGREVGDAAVAELSEISPNVMFVTCDVGREDDVKDCIDQTVERFGALHIAVNNAGDTETTPEGGTVAESSLDEFHAAFRANTDGPFLVSKHAIPHMEAAGYGAIVNISTIAGVRASRDADAGHHASMAALRGLTQKIALDHGPVVHCNEIVVGHVQPSPPALDYHQFLEEDEHTRRVFTAAAMVGRWGSPDDLGHACTFLASPESSFVTATTLLLDGGSCSMSPFPQTAGFQDWLTARHSADAAEAAAWDVASS